MKLSKHHVLLCGILSPVLALILYALVYGTLTRFSADLEKDWLFSSVSINARDDHSVSRHRCSRNTRPT